MTKLKELKRYVKNILRNYKKCKKINRKNKKLKNKKINKQLYKNKIKTYSLKCKKDTENLDSKIFRTKNNRIIMQSKCNDCRTKSSRFAKEQDAKGLLSNLGIKTPFSKIPLLNVFF